MNNLVSEHFSFKFIFFTIFYVQTSQCSFWWKWAALAGINSFPAVAGATPQPFRRGVHYNEVCWHFLCVNLCRDEQGCRKSETGSVSCVFSTQIVRQGTHVFATYFTFNVSNFFEMFKIFVCVFFLALWGKYGEETFQRAKQENAQRSPCILKAQAN